MNENIYCFGLKNEEIEGDLKLNLDSINTNKIIKNFGVYKSDSFYFLMIELAEGYKKLITKETLNVGLVNKFINNNIDGLNNLDCVFKKDVEKQNLSAENSNLKRIVMTLELKNDPLLLNEYKEIHRSENIWPHYPMHIA